jgi:hypothetical protein
MRYRSKPVEVEAMQWCVSCAKYTPDICGGEVVAWVNANGGEARYTGTADPGRGTDPYANRIAVRTINGWAYAAPGHYVIRSAVDFYPCDPETFEQRWEPA